jgi:lysophospholipase L1-like esterase
MQKLIYNELSNYIRFHGRTLADDRKHAVFFNWTCAGFTCTFTGKTLTATLVGIPSPNLMGPDQPDEYPYIGIAADGTVDAENRELIHRLRVDAGEHEYPLFSSETEGPHTVRIVKLSENMRGKCGIMELKTDGSFMPHIAVQPALRIEAVGDSITCGYGNEAPSPMAPFLPEEENGWITYAALASAALNADFSTICVSGISMEGFRFGDTLPMMPGMEDLYAYTDRIYESMDGPAEAFSRWDFSAHPVDAVIINIGTNDANIIRMRGDEREGEARFLDKYAAFLKKVRALNGSKPHILCTLGPMDYYLYDVIRDAAARYQAETGDQRVHCFKFGGIRPWSEQMASGHPSATIHKRMGLELAAKLKAVLGF